MTILGRFQAYYQLTKPGIVYGNVMTTIAGFLFASHWQIQPALFLDSIAGTALVIGSACVFNNYLDRGIDQKMSRTRQRALAAGRIPVRAALLYGACLGAAGLLLLWATNWLVVATGVIAFISYVILYGIAKRRSAYGTLVGTIPGAAPLVAGYVAVSGRFDSSALFLFLIMVVWQMPHFYAIAIRRYDDYKAAGLPVWPVKKGIPSTKRHMLLYGFLFVILNIAFVAVDHIGYSYLLVMTCLGLYWLWRGVEGWQITDSKKWAGRMFGISLLILLVFSGILALSPLLP